MATFLFLVVWSPGEKGNKREKAMKAANKGVADTVVSVFGAPQGPVSEPRGRNLMTGVSRRRPDEPRGAACFRSVLPSHATNSTCGKEHKSALTNKYRLCPSQFLPATSSGASIFRC